MEKKYICGGCGRGLHRNGCGQSYQQLNDYDYLADIPGNNDLTDIVEVQFKNTRKGYYHNDNKLDLVKGDVVAVEASPGHDIGTVTMTGKLAMLQMKKANLKADAEIRRVYRKVRPTDMEKYEEAKGKEQYTMFKSRQIAKNLGLEMKIGDVEYQGDGNKAIFYYIADGRVDFRQLIKVLAEEFRVRIEMKQIGARQEAGRIGGFGPCGRELCCATWMKNFVSVSTSAARFQDLSLNPQKLAGQCAKLKCCMNFEADQYMEASQKLPSREVTLHVADGEFFYFKADILSGMITYSSDKRIAANLTTISAERAKEIIAMNRKGETPESLEEGGKQEAPKPIDLATQDDLHRFDTAKKKKKKKKKGGDKAQRNEEAANNSQNGEVTAKAEKKENPKGQAEGEKKNKTEAENKSQGKDKEGRQDREREDGREGRERKEGRDRKNRREPREQREPRENREPREQNGNNESGDKHEDRENRNHGNRRHNNRHHNREQNSQPRGQEQNNQSRGQEQND
ncbi:MAG: hypothetical protein KBT39_06655 [Bacteroidales bacterium]|nr:hypothetical protein [Bacteroidales bacterium]